MVWNAVAQSRLAAPGTLHRLDVPVGLVAIVNSYPAPVPTRSHTLPGICAGVPASYPMPVYRANRESFRLRVDMPGHIGQSAIS
jgi:hypothetical protein